MVLPRPPLRIKAEASARSGAGNDGDHESVREPLMEPCVSTNSVLGSQSSPDFSRPGGAGVAPGGST